MGLVLSLFSAKVHISSQSGRRPGPVLGSKTLMTRPSFDQCPVHGEMLIRHIRLGSFQHPLEKRLRDPLVQQSLPILAVHRMIPDRLVHLHPHKPPKQQVVLQLLDQHSLAAYGIEDLQQQRPKQPLGRYRWPPYVRVQLRKPRRHLFQNLIHHLADRSQRMIRWYALLWGNVAEHSFLLVIVAAHSLVSLPFLHSDQFSQIKIAGEWGFFNKLLESDYRRSGDTDMINEFLKKMENHATAEATR